MDQLLCTDQLQAKSNDDKTLGKQWSRWCSFAMLSILSNWDRQEILHGNFEAGSYASFTLTYTLNFCMNDSAVCASVFRFASVREKPAI